MSTTPTLLRTTCQDKSKEIRLVNFSDMVVYDKEMHLIAIRFGGYPETVQAMTDAIAAGCNLELEAADGKDKISISSKEGKSFTRSVSHEGEYAEGLLFQKDDDLRSLSLGDDASEDETVHANRDLYIFCEDGSDDQLYAELDRKLAVPLIPEFKDYFISELKKQGILHRLHVRSFGKHFSGWHMNVSEDETEIAAVLEDGLQKGAIEIPGAMRGLDGAFSGINTFTGYLKEFGTQIAQRIRQSFVPLFDPTAEPIDQRLTEVNQYIIEHAGYSLFDAQLGAAEGLKRQLDQDKMAMLVAECGTGKTKIASAALYAHQYGGHGKGKKTFNAVVCPSHVAKKWVRELHETLPDCYAQVASSITDIDKLYGIYQQDDMSVYCIISKETARNGPMRYPAVVWNAVKKGFMCPHCGMIQEMTIFDDGGSNVVNADQLFFKNERSANHKCQNPECKAPLWSCVNPDVLAPDKTPWLRIGGYGCVFRARAYEHLRVCEIKKVRQKLLEMAKNPDGIFPVVGACRRYPLSSYIKRHIRHLDTLIVDELHQYSGESAQGEAMAELAGVADKVIGMTATLINGYSKGMFYLLFRLKPQLMLLDRQRYESPKDFCSEYGIIEKVFREECDVFNASSKSRRRKVRERFLPGVSPLVYARFLLENCVFLSLADMGKELPDYEELPIPCEMPFAIDNEYTRLETEFRQIMKDDRKVGNKLLGAYLNLLSAYPDQPYGHPPVLHPKTHEKLIIPKNLATMADIQPKDTDVLELVERKVKAGERVIIYTAWTRLDSRMKLHKLLTEKGYRVSILDVNISPIKREEWVDQRVAEGIDVLIVNPALVETGLDLNAFTTLVFFNVAYNLYIFRQASRRSWRINQTAPKVEVYMFYYRNTMQQRALKLMASKLSAATVIEGNISDEGLAAMSDCQDMTSALAKELMLGIKGNVDDLADSFRKMAIINGKNREPDAPAMLSEASETLPQQVVAIAPVPAEPAEASVAAPVTAALQKPEPVVSLAAAGRKSKTRKVLEEYAATGQLNLFDLLQAS